MRSAALWCSCRREIGLDGQFGDGDIPCCAKGGDRTQEREFLSAWGAQAQRGKERCARVVLVAYGNGGIGEKLVIESGDRVAGGKRRLAF